MTDGAGPAEAVGGVGPAQETAAELAPARPGSSRLPSAAWPVALAALGVAALVALYAVRGVLAPFGFGAVLAYLVAPAADHLRRHLRLPRSVAILLTYAGLGAAVAAFVAFVLPGLVAELQRLTADIPMLGAAAKARVDGVRAGYRRLPLPPALRATTDAAIARTTADLQAALGQTLSGVVGLVGLGVSAVLAPVLAYYFLADLPHIKAQFARLLPPEARHPVMACLAELDAVLSGWVRGQLMLSAAVSVLVAAGLLLLRVRFALTLGLLAGVGELVPYFGPVLGALPALAVAGATGGLVLAGETLAVFLVIQQIESVFLSPRIVGGSVGLHPLAVIAALLIGEHLAGLGGVVLAVPLAGCARVLGRHVVRALTGVRRPRRLT